jgi:DNA-binding beta-propeller fold protein YncE
MGYSGEAVGQFDGPACVALDSSDNVYVTDVNNHRIQKIWENGDFISSIGNEGEGDGQFIEPEGLDVDSEGNIYVADTGNFRNQVFSQE